MFARLNELDCHGRTLWRLMPEKTHGPLFDEFNHMTDFDTREDAVYCFLAAVRRHKIDGTLAIKTAGGAVDWIKHKKGESNATL